MPLPLHINPRSAALLVMDYQVDTLTRFMTAAQSAEGSGRGCVPQLGAGWCGWRATDCPKFKFLCPNSDKTRLPCSTTNGPLLSFLGNDTR